MNRIGSTQNGMRRVYIDVMIGGRFVCQVPYEYCELFPADYEQVRDYVIRMRPSLKGKNFKTELSDNRV